MHKYEDGDHIVICLTKHGNIWETSVDVPDYGDDINITGVGFSPVAALDSFCNMLEERRVYHETGIFTDPQTKKQREEELEFVLAMTEEESDNEDDE